MITFLVQSYFPGPRSMFNFKTVKARDLLGSCASDIDLVLDWWFYADTYINHSDVVPEGFRYLHLFFTILGTLTWFCLSSDGRAVDWFAVRPLQCMGCVTYSCRRVCGKNGQTTIRKVGVDSESTNIKGLWEQAQAEDNWKLSSVQVSTGFLLLCGILLEDIPQIILTFLVQNYKGEGENSGLIIANLLTSIYNCAIKLADAYDQRKDVVTVSERG